MAEEKDEVKMGDKNLFYGEHHIEESKAKSSASKKKILLNFKKKRIEKKLKELHKEFLDITESSPIGRGNW